MDFEWIKNLFGGRGNSKKNAGAEDASKDLGEGAASQEAEDDVIYPGVDPGDSGLSADDQGSVAKDTADDPKESVKTALANLVESLRDAMIDVSTIPVFEGKEKYLNSEINTEKPDVGKWNMTLTLSGSLAAMAARPASSLIKSQAGSSCERVSAGEDSKDRELNFSLHDDKLSAFAVGIGELAEKLKNPEFQARFRKIVEAGMMAESKFPATKSSIFLKPGGDDFEVSVQLETNSETLIKELEEENVKVMEKPIGETWYDTNAQKQKGGCATKTYKDAEDIGKEAIEKIVAAIKNAVNRDSGKDRRFGGDEPTVARTR